MKRHSDLREFSDDHHGGLVNARRLRRVASGEGGRVARDAALAFLEFWREETGPHFRKEEEVLLPVLARHRQDVESEPVSRMLTQHARIRGLVMELSDQVARDEVLAETLRVGRSTRSTHTPGGAGRLPLDRASPPRACPARGSPQVGGLEDRTSRAVGLDWDGRLRSPDRAGGRRWRPGSARPGAPFLVVRYEGTRDREFLRRWDPIRDSSSWRRMRSDVRRYR